MLPETVGCAAQTSAPALLHQRQHQRRAQPLHLRLRPRDGAVTEAAALALSRATARTGAPAWRHRHREAVMAAPRGGRGPRGARVSGQRRLLMLCGVFSWPSVRLLRLHSLPSSRGGVASTASAPRLPRVRRRSIVHRCSAQRRPPRTPIHPGRLVPVAHAPAAGHPVGDEVARGGPRSS